MKRRDFIVRSGALATAVVGGAAAWPVAASAQGLVKEPSRPVVGFLNDFSPEAWPPAMAGFRRGLNERMTWKVRTSRSRIVGAKADANFCRTSLTISSAAASR